MSHGGRGQVSARSVFLFTSEARADGDVSRGADDAKENSLLKKNAIRSRLIAPSRASSPPRRPPREVFVRSPASSPAPVSPRSTRAASPRAWPALEAFISLFARAVLFSRCVRAFALMNAAFFRARFHRFTPGSACWRSRTASSGARRRPRRRRRLRCRPPRSQTPRWSARSSARTRQPTRATRPTIARGGAR